MENTSKYSVLAPMNGKYNGLIAIHGCNATTIEGATSWAKERFIGPFAVVAGSEIPEMPMVKSETDIRLAEFRNAIKDLYERAKN